MATVGIKKLIINNETIQTKTATAEYKSTGSEKTPILDDGSDQVMFFTKEAKAGSIKVQVSTLKSADTEKLKTLEDGDVILELLDGKTVVGTSMTQTADNSVTVADGVIELEFMGNVVVR